MVCGILAERFPHVVKQIADAGHEVAAHSYTMDMKHGQPPSVYVENFKEWLQYARKREQGACKIDPAVHAHVFGRPAGMWALERVMEIARKSKNVWIGTRAQVAAHVRKVLKSRTAKEKASSILNRQDAKRSKTIEPQINADKHGLD